MKSDQLINPRHHEGGPRRHRRGTNSLDLMVGFTLLLAAISVATPLIVRHSHLMKSQRNYRLALDEMTNQLDILTALPMEDLPQAISKIAPSQFVSERLPGVKLAGELKPAETGTRVTLKILWNEKEREHAPVSLAAWVFPRSAPPTAETVEEKSP